MRNAGSSSEDNKKREGREGHTHTHIENWFARKRLEIGLVTRTFSFLPH